MHGAFKDLRGGDAQFSKSSKSSLAFCSRKGERLLGAPLHVLPWGKRVWSVHFSLLQERDNMRGRGVGGGRRKGGPLTPPHLCLHPFSIAPL